MRASPATRQAYGAIKRRLAAAFPAGIEGYYSIRDPLMDLVFEAAQVWPSAAGWEPDDDHL